MFLSATVWRSLAIVNPLHREFFPVSENPIRPLRSRDCVDFPAEQILMPILWTASLSRVKRVVRLNKHCLE